MAAPQIPHRCWLRRGHRDYWLATWEAWGGLYDALLDQAEADFIRDECEQVGIPMGYGRVGKRPTVLSIDECEPSRRR